jgi:hypothetical protein
MAKAKRAAADAADDEPRAKRSGKVEKAISRGSRLSAER